MAKTKGKSETSQPENCEEQNSMATDFSQTAEQVDAGNYKGIGDNYQTLWQAQLQGLIGLQDKLNAQHLRYTEDAHTLLMRTADANALLTNLAANISTIGSQAQNNDGRIWNNLAVSRFMTSPSEASAQNIGAKVAEDVGDTFNKAIREAAVNSAGANQVANAGMETIMTNQVAAILAGQSTVLQQLTANMAELTAVMTAFMAQSAKPVPSA